MRNAAAERLSKLISETSRDIQDTGKEPFRKALAEVQISMAEGWFSLFLLATIVYSTIWSIQAAAWVDHLNTLTFATIVGLLAGVWAAKQRRFSRLLVHGVVAVLALLLVLWQTAGAFYN